MRVRREVVAALAAIVLTACGAAAAGSPDASEDTAPTSGTVGGVGQLPGQVLSVDDSPSSTRATEPETEPTDTVDEEEDAPESSSTSTTRPRLTTTSTIPEETKTIGEQVMGNRVLMIGDSILASTSRRYGNNMCANLVPLGWQVEIEAEVSREISFGNTVLASRMAAGWDAALVLLGNNYGEKPDVYQTQLNKILTTLAPRPVLLLTVTEFEPIQREVNEVIRNLALYHPNVTVVDWAAMSEFPGVLAADGLHLTDDGREFLAQQLVPYFGTSPIPEGGDCLASKFHDDSAGSVNGPGGNNGGKPPSTSVKPTGTTVKPGTTTTTVRPTGSTTPPTTGSTTPATSPPQTSPPQTSPPQTSPPQTSPPQTSPPVTSPPVTLPPVVPTTERQDG